MSSSLNSIAATAVNDLYKPFRPERDDKHYLKVSHVLTLVWGVVQIGVALAVRNQPGSALSQALSIASLINGPILGVFLVGTLMPRVSQPPALIGMLVSLGSMLYVYLATQIAWTWFVFLGKFDYSCGCVGGEFCFHCVTSAFLCASAVNLLSFTAETQRNAEVTREEVRES